MVADERCPECHGAPSLTAVRKDRLVSHARDGRSNDCLRRSHRPCNPEDLMVNRKPRHTPHRRVIDRCNRKIDAHALAIVEYPGPDERAVLILSSVLNETGPKRAAVPWALQEKAAAFYNKYGLARTLDEIVRLGGPEALMSGAIAEKGCKA